MEVDGIELTAEAEHRQALAVLQLITSISLSVCRILSLSLLLTTLILPGSSHYLDFKIVLSHYSECDGDTRLEAPDDNVGKIWKIKLWMHWMTTLRTKLRI